MILASSRLAEVGVKEYNFVMRTHAKGLVANTARGDARRRTIGFVVRDACAIRGIWKSSAAVEDNRKRQGEKA